MNFERARTENQINKRKKEIISACAKIYDEGKFDEITIKGIGEITSFNRTTIYNYYKTKEEILLDLLLNDMAVWGKDVMKKVNESKVLTKEEYCNFMAENFYKHQRLLSLLSLLFSTLEKNCRVEKLAEFKKSLVDLNTPFYTITKKFFPNASDEKTTNFINDMLIYIIGFYPSITISNKQKKAMEKANYDYKEIDFLSSLKRTLLLLIKELDD